MATEYLSNLGYARQQEEESRLSNIAALAKNKPGATQTGAAAGVDITAIADQITNANKKLSDEYDRFSGSAAEKTKLLLSSYERFKDSLIGTPAEVTKLTAGIADEYEKKLKPLFEDAEKKVVSFSKTFRDQFTEFAQLQLGEKENPYVKLFSEGELAAARAREQFALAGDAVVNQIIKAQKAMQQTEVYELRIKDTLSAVKLEFQAAELSKPFFELTKEMKNTISVFQLELKSALTGPEYLFQARQIETGGYATFQNVSGGALQGLRGGQLEELRRLRARYAGSPGLGGDEVNHLLDQEYIKLYQQLSPGERQQVFQFGGARFDFSNAYRGEAGYNRRQIELQIQRNQAGLANVRLAQQQLGELARISPGQNRDLTRRAFLDITGTLSREELTPDLIKGRAVALQEEARFTREREDRARKAIEQTEKFQNAVIGQLQNLLGAVQGRNEKVLVEVLDRTDTAKIHTLGQSFER
jgi:hypothetical protein